MYIGFNKYQVYGKAAFIIVVLFFIGFFIFVAPHLKASSPTPTGAIIFLIFIGLLICCVTVIITLQLLFLAKGTNIDNANNLLTLTFFGARPILIKANDLVNYSSTLVKTRRKNYEGVLLNLKDGKTFLLSDYNLTDYQPVKTFLEDNNISHSGHEKFTSVIYFIRYFKN